MMTVILLLIVVVIPLGIAEAATLIQHGIERRKSRSKSTLPK